MVVGQSSAQSVNWPTATPASPSRRRPGAGASASGPPCTVARRRPRGAGSPRAGRACPGCRRWRRAGTGCRRAGSGHGARPATRTGEVSSSGRASTTTGSVGHQRAGAATRPTRGPVRSSSQAAPGPCTVASRAPRHSASCSAVMSEKPDHHLGIGPHRRHVEAVHDALHAVAAPGAQHAAHLRVAQRQVQVGQPVVVRGRRGSRAGRTRAAPPRTRRPQLGEQLDAAGHPLRAGRAGRRHEHHQVARAQCRRRTATRSTVDAAAARDARAAGSARGSG